MIVPIIVAPTPDNWRRAQVIEKRLADGGHVPLLAPWDRTIPRHDGYAIYVGPLPASYIQQFNASNDRPVEIIAADDIDSSALVAKQEDKAHVTKRKPRRSSRQ